ncbi:uncharacterized protein LAJ45_07194 [Morchella importuna]|uniref:uncharacterized protein n=1 Tax=Morchella importuna TaxID=1174673 RepID=UPI001E8D3460|nr:uncharacterized protein LAJ45_07194 [Morchella importuna]KAH8148851.1 hypothetical protein LAJ45_07194 [Morchella importuna]
MFNYWLPTGECLEDDYLLRHNEYDKHCEPHYLGTGSRPEEVCERFCRPLKELYRNRIPGSGFTRGSELVVTSIPKPA